MSSWFTKCSQDCSPFSKTAELCGQGWMISAHKKITHRSSSHTDLKQHRSLSHTDLKQQKSLWDILSVMLSNHLILCHLLLLLSVFPSIRVFSSELALCIRWPNYWSFSFNINPSNDCSGLISFRIDWFDLLALEGVIHQGIWGDEEYMFRVEVLKRYTSKLIA